MNPILNLPLGKPLAKIGVGFLHPIQVIAKQKPLNPGTPCKHIAEIIGSRHGFLSVVLGYQTTYGDTRLDIDQTQNRVQYGAPDIVKENINTIGAVRL